VVSILIPIFDASLTTTTTTMSNKTKVLNKAASFGIFKDAERIFKNAENAVFSTKAEAKKRFGFSYLLGIDSSAKISKNGKKGYITGVLYLAAADNVGIPICPQATEGCAKACLFGTGRNSMKKEKDLISRSNKSQFLKTVLFFANRSFFMDWLFAEIATMEKKAAKKGLKPAVRLNGTSDIGINTFTNSNGVNVLEAFPNIQFYDYTKVPNQLKKVTDNYDVTFSFGGFANIDNVFKARLNGKRIAVPFAKETFGGKFPDTFLGHPVVDGDETDLTFLHPEKVVLGLKVKLPIGTKIDLSNDFFLTKERLEMFEKMFVKYKETFAQTQTS
jgi:hypothetical protein